MILKNRIFEKQPPSRVAKSIFIFCEGYRREYDYFKYFRDIDSRINIEVYKLNPHENNSPLGLLKIAEECIISTTHNPRPKFDFLDGDEVWIVLDTDLDKKRSRLPQIAKVRFACTSRKNWFLAQSNPCFEVWLNYHFKKTVPQMARVFACKKWKEHLGKTVNGGFDSRKHPLFIQEAAKNSANNYSTLFGEPMLGATDVFKLANNIVPLIKTKLDKVIDNL